MPDQRGVPRRAGPDRHRQAAEVQAARAVLGRPGASGQLTRARRSGPSLLAALALTVALAAPAAAHTQLQEASPGPAEQVAGPVDAVRLDFLDPLLEAPDVVVTGPDGATVAGAEPAELVADDVAVVRFDPLVEPGRYTVTYDYASLDGAPQTGAHQFTFAGAGAGAGGFELRPALAVLVGLVVVALGVRAVRGR